MISLKEFTEHCKQKDLYCFLYHRQGRHSFEDLREIQSLVNVILGSELIDVICCYNGFGEVYFSTVYNLTIRSDKMEDGFTILPIIIGDVNTNSIEDFYSDIVRDYETMLQLQASKNTSLS